MTMPSPPSRAEPAQRAFLKIRATGRDYALPIGALRSAVRIEALTRVPFAPARLRGLANLRGSITPVCCLNTALNSEATPLGVGALAVVAELGGDLFALAVEAVGDVVWAGADEPLAPLPFTERNPATHILGVLFDGRDPIRAPIPVLDLKSVLDFCSNPAALPRRRDAS